MTTVVISQPMYFPWPGFLAQLSMADVVIWLTDVQFSKGSFTNRVQVRLPSGMSWLSVPLARKGSDTQISNLVAAKENWLASHVATLKQSLKGAPHLETALTIANQICATGPLCDALIASSEGLAQACGITPTQTLLSTQMSVNGSGTNRVLQLVKEVGGTHYVTGHGARNYLDHAEFEAEGIAVEYMDYDVKPWEDDPEFTPFVTGLDLLAKTGPNAASYLNPKTTNWRQMPLLKADSD